MRGIFFGTLFSIPLWVVLWLAAGTQTAHRMFLGAVSLLHSQGTSLTGVALATVIAWGLYVSGEENW